MKFSANFRIEHYRYFLECLSCLNKLTKEISKNCTNVLKITKNKVNIITRTNGILDSYYEIFTNELFVDPITLKEEAISLELNINTLYDSLYSSVKSEDILIYISDDDDEFLYLKYADSLYTTISITLKIPIKRIPADTADRLPEIPYTNYNVNLSKLQTITFLLNSINKIGNSLIDLKITIFKEAGEDENLVSRCNLKITSTGSILNIESEFSNLQVFSSYPTASPADNANIGQEQSMNICMNTNILNTLFKSIIEANLYNKNKALIIISLPDDERYSQFIYIIISIVQLETSQMVFMIPNAKDNAS